MLDDCHDICQDDQADSDSEAGRILTSQFRLSGELDLIFPSHFINLSRIWNLKDKSPRKQPGEDLLSRRLDLSEASKAKCQFGDRCQSPRFPQRQASPTSIGALGLSKFAVDWRDFVGSGRLTFWKIKDVKAL